MASFSGGAADRSALEHRAEKGPPVSGKIDATINLEQAESEMGLPALEITALAVISPQRSPGTA